jgi:UDP-N-acetylglucosamine:LPS N-acetylglucosamine transferase
MNRILIISLNSGGTMGHGKIITSLANFLSQKEKQVIILSDMPFSRNFDVNDKVKIENLREIPHTNYTIGGMCQCNQKDQIYEFARKNNIECVIFSTFFDLNLIKKFKHDKIKTILLSYPIRDTYRLALKQNKAYATFDKVITLYGPEFNDKEMSNERLVNPLKIVCKEVANTKNNDVAVTCGGGGRPSSILFLKKAVSALKKVMSKNENIKVTIIKGNSKSNIAYKDIKTILWTKDFGGIISSSNLIISEAGYFTMLDLINYKKKAILIPGERIIDNQEIRALKLEELGIGKVFFPFEKASKLSNLITEKLQDKDSDYKSFDSILDKFNKYPDLSEVMLEELL